jgi:hypothetical protein
MILVAFSILIGLVGTYGFVHSINRKPTDRISFVEWFVSLGVGSFIAASMYSLLH